MRRRGCAASPEPKGWDGPDGRVSLVLLVPPARRGRRRDVDLDSPVRVRARRIAPHRRDHRAATSLASVPAFILWGSLSDRTARRKIFLLIGFLGSGVALLAMALCGTMSQFYLANLLAGFLGAASGPAGTVLLMETSKRVEWPARLALVSRIGAIGWVAGLGLGIAWLAIGP